MTIEFMALIYFRWKSLASKAKQEAKTINKKARYCFLVCIFDDHCIYATDDVPFWKHVICLILSKLQIASKLQDPESKNHGSFVHTNYSPRKSFVRLNEKLDIP